MVDFLSSTAYSLLDLLKYLLCLTVIFCAPVYKKEITVKVWLAVSLGVCILCYGLFDNYGILYTMPNICTLAFVFLIKKKKYICFIMVAASWIIMDLSTEFIRHLESLISGKYDNIIDRTPLQLLFCKMLVLLVPFFYHIIVNMCIRKKSDYALYPVQLVLILIFGIGIITMVFIIDLLVGDKITSARGYMIMGIVIMSLLALFISVMIWQSFIIRKNSELKQKEISYQYMMESQSKHFDDLIKNENELRKFRHDIRAHMTAIREYAGNSADTKLLEYLSGMEEKITPKGAVQYTGNLAVDAVIRDCEKRIEEAGINFEYDIFCFIREELKDYDLCSVVYNLLNNAIEGAERVDSINKTISVIIKNFGDRLSIVVSNETVLLEIPASGILVTVKEDKVNHGWGMRSIRDVVDRYDGQYFNTIVNGRFISNVTI
ncbi:Sensor histidine kinase YesM [Eubacterium ruminantium]|nr:Sensor histidine kinase YesM [Eubacterium ruminantium]